MDTPGPGAGSHLACPPSPTELPATGKGPAGRGHLLRALLAGKGTQRAKSWWDLGRKGARGCGRQRGGWHGFVGTLL